jgi:DNA replication protein DnaC
VVLADTHGERATALRGHLRPAKSLNRLDRFALIVIDDIGYVRKVEAESSVVFELDTGATTCREDPR